MKELLMKGYWAWVAPSGYTDLNKGKATERNLVVNEERKILKRAIIAMKITKFEPLV